MSATPNNQIANDAEGAHSLQGLVGRRYHDTDKRRYGIIIEIKHGMPLMQLNSGRRFLIFPDVLARNWIECDESPNEPGEPRRTTDDAKH